jgi:serralysin
VNTAYHHEDNHYYYDDSTTYHETIWDSGGIDWIEYGGQQAVLIDLREGQGSFIGTPVLAFDSINEYEIPNVWIAYGAKIEHARGGQNDDLLIGNVHDNILIGGEGRDTLVGLEGNDYLYGEGGIDTAFYLGIRAHYVVNKSTEGFSVIDHIGLEGHDSLIAIERLQFSDLGLALDMDGHAGQVAKFLGAVFGADSISNKEYVKAGLSLLDNGMSNEELALVALDVTDVRTHDETVMLLWRNLFGENPTQNEKQPYLQALDTGEMSIAAITVFAADTAINTSNINLVGLTQSGLEFAL